MTKNQTLLVALVLTAGAAMRIWASWMLRDCNSSDWAVVASMARDMAEGQPFPVFFYGQSYMGSLEPWVASLFVRLLGANGFAVHLGTAVFGLGLLVLIFLWGRRAGGFWAGLAAMAWSTVGSVGYLYFTVSSRGGYGTLLFFGTLAVYAAAHIAAREGCHRTRVSPGWYAVMGLAAGLAWWSHPSAIVFLVPAAGLVVCGLRGRILRWEPALAGAGFLAGSAPWWWWNLTHQWDSFSMTGSFGRVPLRAGIGHGLRTFYRLMDVLQDGPASWWAILAVAILAASLVAVLGRLAWATRQGWRDGDVFLAAAVLSAGCAFAVAVRSHFIQFIQARYLLVLWPAAAVCLGFFSARLARRWGGWLGVLTLVLAGAWQYSVPPFFMRAARDQAAAAEKAHRVARAVEKHDIEVLYGDYWHTWMNFATDRATRIAVWTGEKYAPWEQAAMRADRIAFLDGYAHIHHFTRATMTSYRMAEHGRILHDLKPCSVPFEPLTTGLPAGIHDAAGTDWTAALTDWSLDTGCRVDGEPGDHHSHLTAVFEVPESLTGIDLWTGPRPLGLTLKVEARAEPAAEWRVVLDTVPLLPLFWSGPRLFYGGLYAHTVLRWEPLTAGQWRFTFSGDPRHALRVEIGQMVFLRTRPTPWPDAERDWAALGTLLRDRGVARVYADRWLSQKLAFGGFGLQADVHGAFDRTVNALPAPDAPPRPLRLDPACAMVVERPYAGLTRTVLAAQGVQPAETDVGPWIVFHFGEGAWRETYAMPRPLRWVGPYVLLTNLAE